MLHFVFICLLMIIRSTTPVSIDIPYMNSCCAVHERAANSSNCLLSLDQAISWPITYKDELDKRQILINYYSIEEHCAKVVDLSFENDELRFEVSRKGVVMVNETEPRTVYMASDFCIYDSKLKLLKICLDNGASQQLKGKPKTDYFDCTSKLCISKCCPGDHYASLDPYNFGCLPFENETDTNLKPIFQLVNGTEVSIDGTIAYIVQFPLCHLYDWSQVILLPNGTTFLPSTKELFSQGLYCLDFFKIEGILQRKASLCSNAYTLSTTETIRQVVHPLGFFISCIFLAVTFICHAIIPKLRDMQGFCFMSYVAALFFAFLLLSANKLIPNSFSSRGCVALAVLSQYTLLSSFFWLNIMSFDIWRVIRGSVHAVRIQELNAQEKLIFIIYSVYGWGGPLVVSLATLIIHVLPDDLIPANFIRPAFRTVKCWFSNDLKVLFAYYNGIIAVLFVINIAFYIHICAMLYGAGVAFKCCSKDMSHGGELRMGSRSNLSTFWHRFCLFLLMGLNWTTEVLSHIPPSTMWVLTDVVNTFQGLFIFLLFIRSTKKRTLIIDVWKRVILKAQAKKIRSGQRTTEETYEAKFIKISSSPQNSGIENPSRVELVNGKLGTLGKS